MYNPSPKAILLKYPGTNCDLETARALELVGFKTEIVPISQAERHHFEDAALGVFSGGFSYGDYIMSGRMAQIVTQQKLDGVLEYFVSNGGHLMGICNGFQILTKLGLLPKGNLIDNSSGRFHCRWASMRVRTENSPFLAELPTDRDIELPVAHAEGRFVAPEGMAEEYAAQGLVALQYAEDINGSALNIAGMQDKSGRVFGLMPHPERFVYSRQHYDPDWQGDPAYGWGYYVFSSIYNQCSGQRGLIATA